MRTEEARIITRMAWKVALTWITLVRRGREREQAALSMQWGNPENMLKVA